MTTAYAAQDLIGLGIYTISEAATYARVSATRLARWILGTSKQSPAVRAELDPAKNGDRWVTFLDFIQSLAIREIMRTRPHIGLEKIRETIEMAESKFGITYPFAQKHTTLLKGENLVLDVAGTIVEATGDYKHQTNIRQVVERFLEDVSYDAQGYATKYIAFSSLSYDVVLNPKVRFGEPMVVKQPGSKARPCRYSVKSLCDAFESEGSYPAAAKAYNVSEDAIRIARTYYFDYLQTRDCL